MSKRGSGWRWKAPVKVFKAGQPVWVYIQTTGHSNRTRVKLPAFYVKATEKGHRYRPDRPELVDETRVIADDWIEARLGGE